MYVILKEKRENKMDMRAPQGIHENIMTERKNCGGQKRIQRKIRLKFLKIKEGLAGKMKNKEIILQK